MSKAGYIRISFWARGQRGGEQIQFKAGDIKVAKKKYKDSFLADAGKKHSDHRLAAALHRSQDSGYLQCHRRIRLGRGDVGKSQRRHVLA